MDQPATLCSADEVFVAQRLLLSKLECAYVDSSML